MPRMMMNASSFKCSELVKTYVAGNPSSSSEVTHAGT